MRYGNVAKGADALTLGADTYPFDLVPLDQDAFVGSVAAYIDGQGGSDGDQTLRAFALEGGPGAEPSSFSAPVVVQGGADASWVHFTFDDPPVVRAGHVVMVGVEAQDTADVARLRGQDDAGDFTPSLCVIGVHPYVVPPGVTLDHVATLPLDLAQDALGGGSAPVDSYEAVAGWHYSAANPPAPASCRVRTGGPLADLVGQRVRVTGNGRSVVLYVNDEVDFDEDLDVQLARGAFDRLAPLYVYGLPVAVEVLA